MAGPHTECGGGGVTVGCCDGVEGGGDVEGHHQCSDDSALVLLLPLGWMDLLQLGGTFEVQNDELLPHVHNNCHHHRGDLKGKYFCYS